MEIIDYETFEVENHPDKLKSFINQVLSIILFISFIFFIYFVGLIPLFKNI